MKERGFRKLTPAKDAKRKFLEVPDPIEEEEELPLEESRGRVAGREVRAERSSPHYDRAAMDGYAVRAEDTRGSTRSSPRRLQVSEGKGAGKGLACPVSTGEEVPEGADAVLKVEDSEKIGDRKIETYNSLAPGDNVGEKGEDVEQGQLIVEEGTEIKSSHMSLLRSLGVENILVKRRPKVAVCPTGEELVRPGKKPEPGEAVESNSLMVAEYTELWGGRGEIYRVLTDEKEILKEKISSLAEQDLIVTIGGSSVGDRDRLVEVLEEIGEVFVHGVDLKPGKPLALGKFRSTPIMCLPGYPVAASVDSLFFLKPALLEMLGLERTEFYKKVKLKKKIHSTLGRTTVTRVVIGDDGAVPLRTGGSGVLSSITESDGYVLTEPAREGLDKGQKVKVYPWK